MSKSREGVSKETSPGRKPSNSTIRINPSKRPQHPKPLSILPFTIYSKKPEQGIGPFRVDPTKKSYTVKRSPTKPTEYRGVKSFNKKPEIKSYMEPVENVGYSSLDPVETGFHLGKITDYMEPVENATRTDSIENGIHYSTDSNSKVITHSTPNKKTQRKKRGNKTRRNKTRTRRI